MATKGYIINGVYHKNKPLPIDQMVATQQTMFKQGDHARQRFDHAAEILQPYVNGKPNPKFIEADPDAAAQYGFIPTSDQVQQQEYESDHPAHGSIPWGQ